MTDLFRRHLGDTPLSDEERLALIPSLATQHELNEFEYANILSASRWALMGSPSPSFWTSFPRCRGKMPRSFCG